MLVSLWRPNGFKSFLLSLLSPLSSSLLSPLLPSSLLPFFTSDMLSVRMETVSIKQEESLSSLDHRARLSLAILLDQSEDWRRLCYLMKLAPLEGGFATFSSPTKDLLSMYEVKVEYL